MYAAFKKFQTNVHGKQDYEKERFRYVHCMTPLANEKNKRIGETTSRFDGTYFLQVTKNHRKINVLQKTVFTRWENNRRRYR